MSTEVDTRDRILDAAKAVFIERGTSGARTQEIADVAGVNKALLHYYFQNKDTLAEAVFRRELRSLIQPVFAAMTSEAPLRAKVERAVGLYLEKLSALPQLPGYVLAEVHFHPERVSDLLESIAQMKPDAAGQRIFGALGRQIDEEVAAGRMRPISPHAFMVNLVSLCVFPFAARPLIRELIGGDESFAALIEERRTTLVDFFMGGLRP